MIFILSMVAGVLTIGRVVSNRSAGCFAAETMSADVRRIAAPDHEATW
jgi:hypothetical protein